MTDAADVVVTDGFTGNVALKTLEGGLQVLVGAILGVFDADDETRDAVRAGCCPYLLPLYETLDPDNTGGAMLLGVDGVCIISHGSSSAARRSSTPSGSAAEMVERTTSSASSDADARPLALGVARLSVHRTAFTSAQAGSPVCSRHRPTDHPGVPVPAETHVEQGPIDRKAVFELIRDRLADILEIDPGDINEGDSFADDLEADSLALIELVEALEEELGERTRRVPHRRRGPRGPEDASATPSTTSSAELADGRPSRRRRRSRGSTSSTSGSVARSATTATWPLALAHRSWCAEHAGCESNERLEFLGDAVLGLVVTDHIFRTYPTCPRASWPRCGPSVVSAAALAEVAAELAARRRRCCSARARSGPAGGRSRRSWPTPSRR